MNSNRHANSKKATQRLQFHHQLLASAAWILMALLPAFARDTGESAKPPEHILRKGETLWGVAERTYGNRHYDKLIALHNRITRPERLPAGTVLRVPELGAILAEAGLAPRWQGEIDRMMQARSEYMAVEKKLDELHRAAGAKRVVLPEELRLRLESAERAVDAAIDGFSRPMEGVDRPGKLIGQLRSLSGLLHELAAGANDGYGYDLDMVHQHLAWAMQNAAGWAGKGFRD